MVTSVARQSVILKCLRQKSVMTGNYEFYYAAGLLRHCTEMELNEDMKPVELSEAILRGLPGVKASNEQEEYLMKMLMAYEPQEGYDEQMRELFLWGEKEPDLWKVETSYEGT